MFTSKLGLILAMGLPCAASARLDTDAFVASAMKSASVSTREANRAGDETTGRIFFIDKMQFSTEAQFGYRRKNDHIIFNRDFFQTQTTYRRDYNLKIVPRGFFEQRYERKLVDELVQVEDYSIKKETLRAVEERYLALIDHAVAGVKAQVRKDYLKLSEREISVMSTANRAARSDGRDLIKARESHRQAKVDALDAERAFKASSARLKVLDPELTETQLTIEDLRSPIDAEKTLPREDGIWKPTSVEVDLARAEADLAADEAAYGHARATKLLDSFDFTLQQRDDEDLYMVQFTFNIPGIGGDDYSNREKARRAVWSKVDADTAVREHQSQVELAKSSFEKAMSTYRIFVETNGGESAKAITKRLKRIAQREDSALVLLLEKNELNERLRMTEATAEVLRTYIAYLSATGVLSENLKKNYLAKAVN